MIIVAIIIFTVAAFIAGIAYGYVAAKADRPIGCQSCKCGPKFDKECPECWQCYTEGNLSGYERKG